MDNINEIPSYQSDTMLAFIDILGFKNILSSKKLPEIIEIIETILQEDNSKEYREMLPTLDTKLIGDTFVVYAKVVEQGHVTSFFVYLSNIIASIHKLGRVITRGYISCGDHYYSNDIWISPAFVEAYLGEAKKSIQPRAILGESALNQVKKIYPEFFTNGFLKRDADGYWFVNYLLCVTQAYIPNKGNIIASMGVGGLEKALYDHKTTLIKGLENEKDNLSKYIWLTNYHNNYIKENIKLKNKEDFLIDLNKY